MVGGDKQLTPLPRIWEDNDTGLPTKDRASLALLNPKSSKQIMENFSISHPVGHPEPLLRM